MPSRGIVQRMKQIARSVVPIVDSRTAYRDSGLLVLLYHPIVRHVVEELLHFESRQSGDFCKAVGEDDFLRPRGDDHRLSVTLSLLECRFEGILAASIPANVQFLRLDNQGICCLFSHLDIVFRRIQHFLRINHILNDIQIGVVYCAITGMTLVLRYGN